MHSKLIQRTIQYLHRCLKTKDPLCWEQYNIYIDAWKQKTLCSGAKTVLESVFPLYYPIMRHIDNASFVLTIDEWYILSGGDIVDKLIEISQKGKTTETKYSLDDVMDANKQHDNKK